MSQVDPDVHADFTRMVNEQLARKEARIAQLESELQHLSRRQAEEPPSAAPTREETTFLQSPAVPPLVEAPVASVEPASLPAEPEVVPEVVKKPATAFELHMPPRTRKWTPPATVLPSVEERTRPSGATEPAFQAAAPAPIPDWILAADTPIAERSSTNLPTSAPPGNRPPDAARGSGWNDPSLNVQQYGMKRGARIFLLGTAMLGAAIIVSSLVHGILTGTLIQERPHSAHVAIRAVPTPLAEAPPSTPPNVSQPPLSPALPSVGTLPPATSAGPIIEPEQSDVSTSPPIKPAGTHTPTVRMHRQAHPTVTTEQADATSSAASGHRDSGVDGSDTAAPSDHAEASGRTDPSDVATSGTTIVHRRKHHHTAQTTAPHPRHKTDPGDEYDPYPEHQSPGWNEKADSWIDKLK